MDMGVQCLVRNTGPDDASHGGGGGGRWVEGGRGGWGARGGRRGGGGGGAVDAGHLDAFLAAALTHLMRAPVPIPVVAAASVLHSTSPPWPKRSQSVRVFCCWWICCR